MKRIALAAAALLTAGALHAHDFWIEPSTFHPSPGSTVAVGLRVGQKLVGDPVPRFTQAIDKFIVRQTGRDEPVNGIENSDPAGFLRADGQATALIAYSSKGSPIELPPAKFEDYLRQEGLDRILDLRAKRGERAKPGREIFIRYAKALLTGKKASAAVTQPIGFRYEIIPDDDPTVVHPSPFKGHVLYEGKPLAGALVVAMLRGDPSARMTVRTDKKGAFAFALPRAGVWLLKSVHMVSASLFASADWESLWASLTFEFRPLKTL